MDTSHPSHSKGKRPRTAEKSESLFDKDAFLISLSVKDDARPFGSTRAGEFLPNELGRALASCWRELGSVRAGLHPDVFKIGPRHLQGVLILSPDGPDAPSLSEAVRLFKVLASLRLSQIAKGPVGIDKPMERIGKSPGRKGGSAVNSGSRNLAATEASMLPGKSPSALWKKGYTEHPLSGAAGLAEARKALKSG